MSQARGPKVLPLLLFALAMLEALYLMNKRKAVSQRSVAGQSAEAANSPVVDASPDSGGIPPGCIE